MSLRVGSLGRPRAEPEVTHCDDDRVNARRGHPAYMVSRSSGRAAVPVRSTTRTAEAERGASFMLARREPDRIHVRHRQASAPPHKGQRQQDPLPHDGVQARRVSLETLAQAQRS